MFDSIVGNIFILVPIAIFIALRIAEARKKSQSQNQQNNQDPDSPKPRSIFDLFDNVDEEAYRPQPEVYNREMSQPKPKKTPKQPKRTQPIETLIKSQLSEAENASDGALQKIPQRAKSALIEKSFAERMELLSPLQRAVAMAEILGPPKGF